MRSLFKPGYQWYDEGWRDPNFWNALPGEIGENTGLLIEPVVNQSKKILWPIAIGALAIVGIIYRKEIGALIK